MNTQTFTTDALNEAIAVARGWKVEIDTDGSRWVISPEGKFAIDGGEFPDYCGNIADAIPLLRELPEASLEYCETRVDLLWVNSVGNYESVRAEIGKEAELICRAWYQWKFGVIVEMKEEAQ